MRIKIRLSQETEAVLRLQKEEYERTERASATYGYIVNRIVRKVINGNHQNIDWQKVKNTKIPLSQLEYQKNKEDYSTTLNLENTVVEIITKLQIEFKKVFNASRVHRAFVLRMLVRAYVLEEQNIDIFLQIKEEK